VSQPKHRSESVEKLWTQADNQRLLLTRLKGHLLFVVVLRALRNRHNDATINATRHSSGCPPPAVHTRHTVASWTRWSVHWHRYQMYQQLQPQPRPGLVPVVRRLYVVRHVCRDNDVLSAVPEHSRLERSVQDVSVGLDALWGVCVVQTASDTLVTRTGRLDDTRTGCLTTPAPGATNTRCVHSSDILLQKLISVVYFKFSSTLLI